MEARVKRMGYRVRKTMFYDFESAKKYAMELLGDSIASRFDSLEQYKNIMRISSMNSEVNTNKNFMTFRVTFYRYNKVAKASIRITFIPLYTEEYPKLELNSTTEKAIIKAFE